MDWNKTIKMMGDAAMVPFDDPWGPDDVSPQQRAYEAKEILLTNEPTDTTEVPF